MNLKLKIIKSTMRMHVLTKVQRVRGFKFQRPEEMERLKNSWVQSSL